MHYKACSHIGLMNKKTDAHPKRNYFRKSIEEKNGEVQRRYCCSFDEGPYLRVALLAAIVNIENI